MQEFLERVQKEDPRIKSVHIRSRCGKNIPNEENIQRVAATDFQLIVNEQAIPIRVPDTKRGILPN